jgi:cytochrome c5
MSYAKEQLAEEVADSHENHPVTREYLSEKYDIVEGKKKYEEAGCSMCHENGVMEAPKPGNRKAWHSHVSEGWSSILHHAIKGNNGMPAKGGREDLTEKDIANIVAHMVFQSI